MLLNAIKTILKKRGRARLRAMMRGYRKLRSQDNLAEIQRLKAELSENSPINNRFKPSKIMFGASIHNAELLINQYLYVKLLLTLRFNVAILVSIGSHKPIKYPLPGKWQDVLKENGYQVNFFACSLLWCGSLFLYYGYGIFRIFKTIFLSIKYKKRLFDAENKPYAYFLNMHTDSIPTSNSNFDHRNIITWYISWAEKPRSIKLLCHDADKDGENISNDFQIFNRPLALLDITDIKSLGVFLVWTLKALIISTKDIIIMRWWTLLLFEQFVLAALTRILPNKFLAKDYLFHNSTWIYKPIWTYEAEKTGSRILFYFYSSNIVEFKPKNGYPKNVNGWNLSSWPNVLVWDKWQANFVKEKFYSYENIRIVGPILISSSNYDLSLATKFSSCKKVALFDVLPRRSSIFQSLGVLTEYYSIDATIKFLHDVYEVLIENDLLILHKSKRDSNTTHPNYRYRVKNFDMESRIIVDPNISAYEVIDMADLVISMPFTSTAILSSIRGKPSIFYDPLGSLEIDDRCHGVKVITGKDSLQAWIDNHLIE